MSSGADYRLAVPAAGVWVACALGISFPDSVTAIFAVLVLLALTGGATAVLSAREKRVSRVATMVALVAGLAAASTIVIALREPVRYPPAAHQAATQRNGVTISFRIESAPRPTVPRQGTEAGWSMRGTTIDSSGTSMTKRLPAGIPLTLVVNARDVKVRDLTLGATLSATVTLRESETGATTSFRAFTLEAPRLRSSTPPWLAWTIPLRTALADAASATPGDGGTLLPGLAIGDESAVSSSLDQSMKTSSLSHLTAVSGANCALVTGLVFALFSWIGCGRRVRIVGAITALVVFVLLVGPSASVLRAAVMALIVLVGMLRARSAEGLSALGLASLVLLIHNPWLAKDYGFALSVLATAGLLILARPLTVFLSRWMPRALAALLAIPTAAQLMCQPVLVLLNPALPLYGIPANILAAPAAPAATVLGALACAFLPWASVPWITLIGHSLVWLAWLPSAWIALIAHAVSDFPAAAVPLPSTQWGIFFSLMMLAGVVFIVFRRRLSRALVVVFVGFLASLTALGVGSGVGQIVLNHVELPKAWTIAACDVGQGDALFVRSSGVTAMIDVGPDPDLATACADRLGVMTIDLLVLTHFDSDHVGGLRGIVSRVRQAFISHPARPSDVRVVQLLESSGAVVSEGHSGLSGELGSIHWKMLWPPEPHPQIPALTGNAGSLVLHAEGEGVRSLFLGDLGAAQQRSLMRENTLDTVDVVKVAHHGSRDQTAELYTTVHARLGLVSVGAKNTYGHPRAETLALLADAGTLVARTDLGGMLLVSPTHSEVSPISLWAEHSSAALVGADPYPGKAHREESNAWQYERILQHRYRYPSCHGTRSGPLLSSLFREQRVSLPIGRSVTFVTVCTLPIPVSKPATFPLLSTPRVSFLRERAPPFLLNHGLSV